MNVIFLSVFGPYEYSVRVQDALARMYVRGASPSHGDLRRTTADEHPVRHCLGKHTGVKGAFKKCVTLCSGQSSRQSWHSTVCSCSRAMVKGACQRVRVLIIHPVTVLTTQQYLAKHHPSQSSMYDSSTMLITYLQTE